MQSAFAVAKVLFKNENKIANKFKSLSSWCRVKDRWITNAVYSGFLETVKTKYYMFRIF